MNTADSMLLQEIDPHVLGDRLRGARLAKGWTQTDMAGDLVSIGYISRLESGQRRPNAAVLESLASRLDIAIDELLRGPTASEQDAIKLALDFAELALENGDHGASEAEARTALARAAAVVHPPLIFRAHYLLARALEGLGRIDDAILELEPLVEAKAGTIPTAAQVIPFLEASIALSRCYRISGDLSLAVEVGEQGLARMANAPLEGTDQAVQLACNLAAAYFERGDTGRAVRTCRIAIDQAEKLGTPKARASAYWNASIMESERGSLVEAIPLAERALALLAEGRDGRNLARLRMALGEMQLRLDPPDVSQARAMLDLADQELRTAGAGALDIASNDVIRARAHLLAGELLEARELSVHVHDSVASESPLAAADAKAIEGQAAAALGDLDLARRSYGQAVMLLTAVGADRDAAELWFELAGLFEAIGDVEGSRDAYRSAAASTGLRSRPVIPAAVAVAID